MLGFMLAGRDGRLLLIAAASIAGAPLLGLWAVATTSALALIIRVGSVIRRAYTKTAVVKMDEPEPSAPLGA